MASFDAKSKEFVPGEGIKEWIPSGGLGGKSASGTDLSSGIPMERVHSDLKVTTKSTGFR